MQQFYYMTAFFLIYSFLGWVVEVVYHAVSMGTIVNRGFLNGPVCPIYGFGMLAILLLLYPFMENSFLIFLGGMAVTTLIELVGGFLLYRIFHMRWWDYSKEPFNFGGYICLKFSIFWGLGTVFILKIIHPFILLNVHIFDCMAGYVLTVLLYAVFVADCVITVLTITKLNRDLEGLNRLGQEMRRFSDGLTENIGEGAIEANTKLQEGQVQAALARAELKDGMEKSRAELMDGIQKSRSEFRDGIEKSRAELKEGMERRRAEAERRKLERSRRLAMLKERIRTSRYFGTGRLLNAFPDLRHERYNEELQELLRGLKPLFPASVRKSEAEREEKKDE